MYWNPKMETMNRDVIRAFQFTKLLETAHLVYEKVPAYKKKFDEVGVKPSDIKTLEDIHKLPFTEKKDLRENYPYGLFAVDLDDIVRLHASSGTTGKPTVVGYTQGDLDTWTEMMSRALVAAGADSTSIIQNFHGYGLFTGGLGMHYGIENIGATAIPTSTGNTERQLLLMKDLKATFVGGTPSYAIFLADSMAEFGITKDDLAIKNGVFGGEPWTEGMRSEIESKLGLKAHNLYGLSELYGPSLGIECSEQNGLHIWEDVFIVEIIDPDTMQPVPEGEYGELVITPIIKEGMPLIRYRTRDITRIIPGACPCGRTHVRIERLQGRTDDMLIIRGVNVFPSQIEEAILKVDGISPHYQILVSREAQLDVLEVQVEVNPEFATDDIRKYEALRKRTQKQIQSIIGVHAEVSLREPNTLPRYEGKSRRVTDTRQL